MLPIISGCGSISSLHAGRHGDQLLWPVLCGGDSVLASLVCVRVLTSLGMCRNAQGDAIRVAARATLKKNWVYMKCIAQIDFESIGFSATDHS